MASKYIPTSVATKESRHDLPEQNNATSSALVEIPNHETQVQPYAWGGELVGPQRAPESPIEETSSFTFVVGHHEPGSKGHNFLDWVTFEEVTLPPKENVKRSRRDKIFTPLEKFKVELPGDVSIEGLGGLVESAHNLFHSPVLLDFMESKRNLLITPDSSVASKAKHLTPKELERLEIELFDLTKFNGSSEFLTAVTWSEEGESGSITLYRVISNSQDVSVAIRPIAAMQEVPKSILVSMRTHDKIKRKVVFVPSDDDVQGFKWKANPSRGPTYVKLGDDEEPNEDEEPPSHSRDRRSTSRNHSRRGSSRQGPKLADADGVRATIPQFVALLHANRSILEDIESSRIELVETDDGKAVPSVNLSRPPRPNSHEGDSVHVAVLIPNEAEWADEHILWTDKYGLQEFRRRKFWDLIEKERTREHGSRSESRHNLHSRHASPRVGSGPQSRPQSRSRSRSRELGHRSRSGERHLSSGSYF